MQRHAAEEIREALQSSPLQWTLVNAPRGVPGLTIEHFSQIGGNLEPGLAEPLERLARIAVGIADELHLNLHIGEHVNFIATDSLNRNGRQRQAIERLRTAGLFGHQPIHKLLNQCSASFALGQTT